MATQWGVVQEPSYPVASNVCATLQAPHAPVNGSVDALDAGPAYSQPDTALIQKAIDGCPSGRVVKLVAGVPGATAFLSGPLHLKSGVQLWIDRGVTLFASRNPADYDNGPGTCGTATVDDANACDPFIAADNTVGSGIVGLGAIDGRGGSLLTSGPNAGTRSWWDVAWQNKSQGLNQQNPRLLQVKHGSNFVLHDVTLMNAANFHVVTTGVTGVTAWGLKIATPSLAYTQRGFACPAGSTPDKKTPATCFTPDTVKNTDGFDPGQSSKVLLAYSYISTGDDHVAVKSSSGPTSMLTFAHNHFYTGHGLSIGSETNTGVTDMVVTDLSIDGYDSPNGNGLRIKSDSSRGGTVRHVAYSKVCMRNVAHPLVFDAFYSGSKGSRYPAFSDITLSGVHNLGSARFGGGGLAFVGYELNGQHDPLEITLDNVVFDGKQPTFDAGHNGSPKVTPAYAHFTLGPGTVSFASGIKTSTMDDVTVSGTMTQSVPVDCSTAFVPLGSVVSAAPI